jgi:hypothetical protein
VTRAGVAAWPLLGFVVCGGARDLDETTRFARERACVSPAARSIITRREGCRPNARLARRLDLNDHALER